MTGEVASASCRRDPQEGPPHPGELHPHARLPQPSLAWSFPLPYAQHRQTVSPCLLA